MCAGVILFGRRRRQRQIGNCRDPEQRERPLTDQQYQQLQQEAEDEDEKEEQDSVSIRTHAEEQVGLNGQESAAYRSLASTCGDGST